MNLRTIIRIDEDKCNGCGLCVPNCAEGAIQIIDGKARLVAENLCDGIGDCLGHCPEGALTLEQRQADAFDMEAVEAHLASQSDVNRPTAPFAGGCPGSRVISRRDGAPRAASSGNYQAQPSELQQWPVQLGLVPAQAPFFQAADLLIAADCVPFAYPDFHRKLLRGKSVLIACPKLDNVAPYVDKLTTIFAENDINSITIARMEVPCCGGLERLVSHALELSGRKDIPVYTTVIGVQGELQRNR